jgi:hypothetical protein
MHTNLLNLYIIVMILFMHFATLRHIPGVCIYMCTHEQTHILHIHTHPQRQRIANTGISTALSGSSMSLESDSYSTRTHTLAHARTYTSARAHTHTHTHRHTYERIHTRTRQHFTELLPHGSKVILEFCAFRKHPDTSSIFSQNSPDFLHNTTFV